MNFVVIRSLCVVAGIGVLAAAGETRAASPGNDEDTFIRHGIELRKAQDDLAARAEFQKAYDLFHSPRAAAQLGLAEFAIGRWDDAEAHVSEALRAPADAWIKKYAVELNRSLATIKTHVARIDLTGEPIGAEVWVNGRQVGQLPLGSPVAVSEGQVDVELRARGFAHQIRTVTVSGGQYQRMVIRLEREAAASQGAAAPVVAAPMTIAPPPSPASDLGPVRVDTKAAETAEPQPQPQTEPSAARRVIKWTALGLAGAALATGITATVVYQRNSTNFGNLHNQGCFDNGGRAVDAAGNFVAECQPSLDAYRSARKWQIAGFVAAGVFATTWLVLALTEPSPSGTGGSDHAMAGWTCAPTLAALGAACAARF